MCVCVCVCVCVLRGGSRCPAIAIVPLTMNNNIVRSDDVIMMSSLLTHGYLVEEFLHVFNLCFNKVIHKTHVLFLHPKPASKTQYSIVHIRCSSLKYNLDSFCGQSILGYRDKHTVMGQIIPRIQRQAYSDGAN